MASRNLGTLTIDMLVNLASLKQGMTAAEREVDEKSKLITGALKSAAAFIAATFTIDTFRGMIDSALEAADAAQEMGEALGITANQFLKLDAAVKVMGAGNVNITAGFTQLNKLIAENSDKLTGLGIATKDAEGYTRDAYDVFLDLSDQFSTMADGADKAALAADLFGARVGVKLIPVLNAGRKGFDELVEGIAEISPALAQAQRENESLMFKFDQNFALLRNTMAEKTVPIINDLLDWFDKFKPTLEPVLDVIGVLAGILGGTLTFALKSVLTTLSLVMGTFEALAKIIATTAAAVVMAAQGEWRGAWETIKAGAAEVGTTFEDMGKQLVALWGEDEKNAAAHAEKMKALMPVDMTLPTVTVGGEQQATASATPGIEIVPFQQVLDEQAAMMDEYRAEQVAADQFVSDQKMARWADELAAEAQFNDETVAIAKAAADKKKAAFEEGLTSMGRLLQQAGEKNKTIAKAAEAFQKVMALRQIAIDTPKAAMAAASAVAMIPIVGPGLAAAAAAAMYGLGAMAAAAVLSGGGGGSGGSQLASISSTAGSPQQTTAAAQEPSQNIYLHGLNPNDIFSGQQVIDLLNLGLKDGGRIHHV